jgi:hypothetical protein
MRRPEAMVKKGEITDEELEELLGEGGTPDEDA